jgi:hypothetical protein
MKTLPCRVRKPIPIYLYTYTTYTYTTYTYTTYTNYTYTNYTNYHTYTYTYTTYQYVGEKILARHPFSEQRRAYVCPTSVRPLLSSVFDGSVRGEDRAAHSGFVSPTPSLESRRDLCIAEVASLRQDHVRLMNPTPFKLSVSQNLFNFIHKLWMDEAPIADLS